MIVTTENHFEELAIVKAEGVCLRMGMILSFNDRFGMAVPTTREI